MTERSTPKTAEMMQQVLAKGWAPDENLPAENLEFVPVWIYSYGYEAGCRLHGQMLKAIYENGLPQDFLSSLTLNAGDEYANKLAIFDTRSSGATEEDKQNLLAHMFNFTPWNTSLGHTSLVHHGSRRTCCCGRLEHPLQRTRSRSSRCNPS
jgi:hypothetical protein